MKRNKEKPTQDTKTKVTPDQVTKEKTAKPPKLRNLNHLKTIRILIYIALVFLMLRGILSIVLPKDTDGIAQELGNRITTVQTDSRIADEVSAFAKSFVRVYLTYEERGNDNYRKSLQQYCGNSLISDICESITFQNAATTTYTEALKVNQYSPTQFDVQVIADVIYTKYATIEETQQPMDVTKSETIYLDVPVLLVGDKMVIEDIPLLTAPPNIGEVNRNEFTGSYAEDTDKNAAKLMLEDFFKTLYGDSQSKIDYYLAPGADTSKFIARNSPYTYEQIDKFSLFTLGNGNYRAILTIRMNDPNGTRVRQRFNVELIRDGKFYIKDIGLRGYNLK